MTLIRELIDIPEHADRGQLGLKLEKRVLDPDATLKSYVLTEQLVACFDDALKFIQGTLQGRTSKTTYLRQHAYIDTATAAELLQVSRDDARAVLDQLAQPKTGFLDRRGRTKAVPYHLNKAIARDLLGKATYTKTKGVDPLRYQELVRQYVLDHGSITPAECRTLLGLGESRAAQSMMSRYLRAWSGSEGPLRRVGSGRTTRYEFRGDGIEGP